jgi:hypothetical protein
MAVLTHETQATFLARTLISIGVSYTKILRIEFMDWGS